MENAPLKSSKEIALKKAEKIEDAEEIKKPLENSKDVAIRKTELTNLEVNSEKDAVEKMKQLAKKNGLDISKSVEEKTERIEEMQKMIKKEELKENDLIIPEEDVDKAKNILEKNKIPFKVEKYTERKNVGDRGYAPGEFVVTLLKYENSDEPASPESVKKYFELLKESDVIVRYGKVLGRS